MVERAACIARPVGTMAIALMFLCLNSLGAVAALEVLQGFKPISPQPDESALKPGLSVIYYNTKVRWMDELILFAKHRSGERGEPLAALNYPDRGPGAKVLGTRQAELVGAFIDGLIKFDMPGRYELSAIVNDGFHFVLDGQLLIAEETTRPSEFTDVAVIQIDEPGWYTLHIKYFQRKGTAALELYWRRPDQSGDPVVVPAEAYAHISE